MDGTLKSEVIKMEKGQDDSQMDVVVWLTPFDEVKFRVINRTVKSNEPLRWDQYNVRHRHASSTWKIWEDMKVSPTSRKDFLRLDCNSGWNPSHHYKDGCGFTFIVPNRDFTAEELMMLSGASATVEDVRKLLLLRQLQCQ